MAGDCNAQIAKFVIIVALTILCFQNYICLIAKLNEKFKIIENLNIQLYRESKDTKTNARGYTLIDICRSNDLFILNGRYGEDKNVGQFTFRDKSVIDYVMATAHCFHLLHNFSITDTDNCSLTAMLY